MTQVKLKATPRETRDLGSLIERNFINFKRKKKLDRN